MGVLMLVARLNSSKGSNSPFPKDVLWERSLRSSTYATRRLHRRQRLRGLGVVAPVQVPTG